jgi:hypothetical protein
MVALQPAVEILVSVLKTVAALSRLAQLPVLVSKIPHDVILAGHCLAVAGMSKTVHTGRLASYVTVSLPGSTFNSVCPST